MPARSSSSAAAFSALWMSTSGSMIGTRPASMIWLADLELLVDDGLDAVLVGELDHRAHLRPEHALVDRPRQQLVETRGSASSPAHRRPRRPGPCRPSGTARPASSTTGSRPSPAPSMSRSIVPSNRMAPRMRSPLKLGLMMIRDAHGVHGVEHLVLARVRVWRRCRTWASAFGVLPAALVQRGDEAAAGADLLELLLVHRGPPDHRDRRSTVAMPGPTGDVTAPGASRAPAGSP